jgi:hypothetical protein
MSNQLIVEKWGAAPNFAVIAQNLDCFEGMPEIKTYFGRFKNPIGIEVECEGLSARPPKMKFWDCKEDGSLRNNGREFVSHPLSGRMIDYALHELGAVLSAYSKRSWSHRTSIHVHQNFSTMREQQLMGYTMAYVLFEELFYKMVAPFRAANAFCYKATAMDPVQFVRIQDTNKYCGLNLAPLKRQCTVEFRQMHGTDDLTLLRRWIQLIVKLHAWVEAQPSRKVVGIITNHIEQQTFYALAKEIWGVNTTLFSDQFIHDSAHHNALWALCLSNLEYV